MGVVVLSEDSHSGGKMSIVLVSGWSFDSSLWHDLIEGYVASGGDRAAVHCLDWHEFGQWVFDVADCSLVEAHARGNTLWVGWSLGGALILEAQARGKLCPRQSLIVSASPRFLQDAGSGWMGMPEKNWQALRRQVGRSPDAALAGFDSWLGLPPGLPRQREGGVLQQGLDWLAAIDRREWLESSTGVIHWVFGTDDPLMPTQQWTDAFVSECQRYTVLPGSGHALPWIQKEYLMNLLLAFSAHGTADV